MAVRRRVAKALSPLKRIVGIQTPILDLVPLRAEIISQMELDLPRVLGRIPVIVRGKAYGEVAGRWYRVVFPRAIQDPSVVAIGEGRTGEIPKVTAPKISIPSFALPKISRVKVPTVKLPTVKHVEIPELKIPFINLSFPYYVTDVGILKELVEALNKNTKMLYKLQGRVNDGIERLNTALDKIKETFIASKDALVDLRNKVQTGFNEYRGNINVEINGVLSDVRKKVQTAFNQNAGNTESSVNAGLAAVLPSLYNAWGIPHIMVLTPLHVRNVTITGFDFQSYGKTTCYYIAVGERL